MPSAKPRASTRSPRKKPLQPETPNLVSDAAGASGGAEPDNEVRQEMSLARDLMMRMAPEEVQNEEIFPASAVMCHIMLLHSVLERRANRCAEEHGLTFTQWMALGCIGNGGKEGLRHLELGQRLMLSKAPVTGVVDRLERGGYVQRQADRDDRRASRIVITANGLEAWNLVRGALRENAKAMCAHMTQDEQNQLLQMLAHFLEKAAEGDPILSMCRERGK